MAKQERINWDKVKWTPFQEASYKGLDPTIQHYKEEMGAEVFLNSIYQVERSIQEAPPPFGFTVYLSIKTRDKQPRHDWRELQRIKNELVGEEVEAVEVYPAESRLVDTSNQYHLYCFPRLDFEERRFPFGYQERLVSEGSTAFVNETGAGSRQRDFRPEFRPVDLVRAEVLDKVTKAGAFITGTCPSDGSPWAFKGEVMLENPEGKMVKFYRGECLKGKHLCFFTSKESTDDTKSDSDESGPRDGSETLHRSERDGDSRAGRET